MTTISIQILKTARPSAPGKLADAEIHFVGGELDGLKAGGLCRLEEPHWRGRGRLVPIAALHHRR
jgi:hypothetical protein